VKLEVITFLDHASENEWVGKTSAMNTTPAKITAVGKVIAEDKKTLNLASVFGKNGHGKPVFTNIFIIVKSCITKRKKL